MRCHKPKCYLLAFFSAALVIPAQAEIILGAGLGADDSGGVSLNGIVDVGLGDNTFVTVSAGGSDGDTVTETIESRWANIDLTQRIGDFGVRVGFGKWGDADRLETTDTSLAVFWQGASWRFGLDYERRDIDLTFAFFTGNPPLDPLTRTANADADGVGFSLRYRNEARTSLYLSGRDYDYSVDLNRLTVLDFVRRISPTTLTLAGALRDFQISTGVEWEAGKHLLGVELARDRLAIGAFDVTSLTGTIVVPAGRRSDIEFSLGYSDSTDADGSAFAGVFVYFYPR